MTRWQLHSVVSQTNVVSVATSSVLQQYTRSRKNRCFVMGCAKKKVESIDPEAKQAVWKCPAHPKKDVDVIDTTCGNNGMCHTCALTDHAGHSFEDVEKFEKNLRGDLRKQLAKVVGEKNKYEGCNNRFDRKKMLLHCNLDEVRRDISATVDGDILGLRNKQQEMDSIVKQRAEEEIQRETQRIKSQMEADISKNKEEADERVASITSRGLELNKELEKEEAVWTEEANKRQKDVETLTDELGTLTTLKDAAVQSLVEKTNDIKLLDGKELPKIPPLKHTRRWGFFRHVGLDGRQELSVGEIRSGKQL